MTSKKRNALVPASVTWRKTGDIGVLLDLETSEYYSLNDTGTFIWEMLDSGTPPESIPAAVAEEFAVSPEKAASDTAAFLKELAELKLLGPETKK